jgi:ABC-type transporter Mla maintaining outer membrane lipid asymmetry permease subunit MlaE
VAQRQKFLETFRTLAVKMTLEAIQVVTLAVVIVVAVTLGALLHNQSRVVVSKHNSSQSGADMMGLLKSLTQRTPIHAI